MVMVFTPFEMVTGVDNRCNVRLLLFTIWTHSLICWGCKIGVAGSWSVAGNILLEGMFIVSILKTRRLDGFYSDCSDRFLGC